MRTSQKISIAAAALVLCIAGALSQLLAATATPPAPVPVTAPTTAPATKPAGPLEVYPAEINLTGARARQAIICKFTQPDGVTRDVTTEAQLTFADPAIARIEGNVVKPLAD